jgi:hypothetical protein
MTEIKENFRYLQISLSYPRNTIAELIKKCRPTGWYLLSHLWLVWNCTLFFLPIRAKARYHLLHKSFGRITLSTSLATMQPFSTVP